MSRNNRFQRQENDRQHYSRDRSDRRDQHSHHHRDSARDEQRWRKDGNRDRHYDNRYGNYRNNEKNYYQKEKQQIDVFETKVDAPAQFSISRKEDEFAGKFKVDFKAFSSYPARLEETSLGDLKNMITPIEKLWTSHIKQYLNISEFVEIYRKGRSLEYSPIEYGKSIINYNQGALDMVYDNSVEQSPIFSRAYFKLWEILELGVLAEHKNKPLIIGCVAQGPGGFIHALLDYRQRQHKGENCPPKDTFHAITLRIDESTRNAKDWSDPRAKKLFDTMRRFGYKINLSYGSTKTGDLLKNQNIEYFRQEVRGKCELVTGDGGIECIGDKEFEYQQVFNAKLFFGEILTAFHIQKEGGHFILKIYDCGFEVTRQLIMLLALYYSTVRTVKPITSRPGNSERYLLCQGFRGISEEELDELKKLLVTWTTAEPKISYFQNQQFAHNLFDFSHLKGYSTIYENIKLSNDFFVKEQEEKLEEGLKLAEDYQDAERIEEQLKKRRFIEQTSFAFAWCKKYGLPTIKTNVIERMKE